MKTKENLHHIVLIWTKFEKNNISEITSVVMPKYMQKATVHAEVVTKLWKQFP
jgi:hypothetical protein